MAGTASHATSSDKFLPFIRFTARRHELRRLAKRLLLYFLGLFLVTSLEIGALAQTPSEEGYLLKAVFVFNFAKFTRWPKDTWNSADDSLDLCTQGEDGVVDALGWLQGKTVKGHPVHVLPLQERQAASQCQVLYIAASEQGRFRQILHNLQKQPILTVSELQTFVEGGGGVELLSQADKIRFKINLDATRNAGLELSSRLLNLAVEVIQDTAP